MSTCKKSGYSIDLFWRYVWLKTHAIWLAENILANISGTKNFPNMGFVLSILNNTNFHYRTNSTKINDHIFQQIQKTVFGPFLVHFPDFWSKKLFFRKFGPVMHNFKWVSCTMPKIWRKCRDRQKNGRTDKPYLIGTFRLPQGGPISRLENLNFIRFWETVARNKFFFSIYSFIYRQFDSTWFPNLL